MNCCVPRTGVSSGNGRRRRRPLGIQLNRSAGRAGARTVAHTSTLQVRSAESVAAGVLMHEHLSAVNAIGVISDFGLFPSGHRRHRRGGQPGHCPQRIVDGVVQRRLVTSARRGRSWDQRMGLALLRRILAVGTVARHGRAPESGPNHQGGAVSSPRDHRQTIGPLRPPPAPNTGESRCAVGRGLRVRRAIGSHMVAMTSRRSPYWPPSATTFCALRRLPRTWRISLASSPSWRWARMSLGLTAPSLHFWVARGVLHTGRIHEVLDGWAAPACCRRGCGDRMPVPTATEGP